MGTKIQTTIYNFNSKEIDCTYDEDRLDLIEMLANICDLRVFRGICLDEYDTAIAEGVEPRKAYDDAIKCAYSLNESNEL